MKPQGNAPRAREGQEKQEQELWQKAALGQEGESGPLIQFSSRHISPEQVPWDSLYILKIIHE